jgi:hypothetical protein
MPHACIRLRQRPPYHGDTVGAVLKRMGYRVGIAPSPDPKPGDVLVLWNRYANDEAAAAKYEKAGATVLVFENGYWGRDWRGSQWYAIARNQHNGCGTWAPPDVDKWNSFGIDLAPWKHGREIVVLAQRGIGSALVRSPTGWAEDVAAALRRRTDRPIRIRNHPGPQGTAPPVSLADDLSDAWATVTWASSAGLRAIAMGVPVFYGLPNWIGAKAARPLGHDIEDPFTGARVPMFAGVASAMWPLCDIENGKVFECLLG